MSVDKGLEREDFYLQRQQHPVSRQLVDLAQGTLHGLLILGDAQLRLAGEITDAVHKELNVLLKRCTGRKGSVVAPLQSLEHKAATGRQHITQH